MYNKNIKEISNLEAVARAVIHAWKTALHSVSGFLRVMMKYVRGSETQA